MHTYVRNREQDGRVVFVVGHKSGDIWQPLLAFTTVEDATRWVSFLNGGADPAKTAPASEAHS